MANKVKVLNFNPFKVGINFSDGVKSVTIPPYRNGRPGSLSVDVEEIYYVHSTSSTFSRKFLIIDDPEINKELGLEGRTVANYTEDEIRDLIKGNINKMKSVLENEKEKHVIDRVINIAKDIDDLHLNKVKFLEEWSGIKFEHLQPKEDGSQDKK